MRYTHNIRIIRKRKHVVKISLVITSILILLIFILGFTEVDTRLFFGGFLESLIRVTIAYVFALIIALTTALLVTSNATVESIMIPVLDALQSFPAFALFPLLIVWFGKGSLDVVLILVIEMLWPILFTVLSAKKQIRGDLIDAANIFGAKGKKYLNFVLLPLLFPSIITGSIVSWGEAWETIIAAEIIVGVPGVGTYLTQAGNANNTSVLVIGIIILLAILFILNKYFWLTLLNISTKYQQ